MCFQRTIISKDYDQQGCSLAKPNKTAQLKVPLTSKSWIEHLSVLRPVLLQDRTHLQNHLQAACILQFRYSEAPYIFQKFCFIMLYTQKHKIEIYNYLNHK